jgi:hypothetical protein
VFVGDGKTDLAVNGSLTSCGQTQAHGGNPPPREGWRAWTFSATGKLVKQGEDRVGERGRAPTGRARSSDLAIEAMTTTP